MTVKIKYILDNCDVCLNQNDITKTITALTLSNQINKIVNDTCLQLQMSEPYLAAQHTIFIKKRKKWNYTQVNCKIKRSYNLPNLDVVIIICI